MRLNNTAPAHEEPVDWFAEFNPEPEPVNTPAPKPPEAGLSMFPSNVVERSQQGQEQMPLLHVVPPAPPTGSQARHGEYLDGRSSFTGGVMPGLDQRVERLPQYRNAMVALLRRRRKVFLAMAAVLVISTAATAGSLAVRRWQRAPETVSDQRSADAGQAASPAGQLGASLASRGSDLPAQVQMPTLDTLAVTSAVTQRSSPSTSAASQAALLAGQTSQGRSAPDAYAGAARPTPSPTTTPTLTPSPSPAAATVRTFSPPPPTATPSPTPTATPARTSVPPVATPPSTPTPTPTRTSVPPATTPTSTPAPTVTAAPTPTATPTSTPTAPARPTPTPRDDAKVTAPPAAPAVSPEAATRSAIQGVIDRYRQAFDSLSVDAVADFWPSVNVKSLSRAFDQLASQQLTFDGCTIDLRDTQADATCRGRSRYVPKVGSHTPRVDNHQWTFLLQRSSTGWAIMKVDVK